MDAQLRNKVLQYAINQFPSLVATLEEKFLKRLIYIIFAEIKVNHFEKFRKDLNELSNLKDNKEELDLKIESIKNEMNVETRELRLFLIDKEYNKKPDVMIRVTKQTKENLEKIKPETETYDTLLSSLIEVYRREEFPETFIDTCILNAYPFLRKVRSRFFIMCQSCNKSRGIEVHHKDLNVKNNKLENLIIVCRKCHFKIHKRGKKNQGGVCK